VRADFRAQNRLDFRRIVRIGVGMGWPSQSRPLKGSPRDFRGFGSCDKSGAANQRSLNMSTPSIANSRNLKTAASKKRSVKSSATARHEVTSAATAAKVPPKSDEPKVERVTKQERLLTLLSQAELAGTVKKKLGFSLTTSKAAGDVRRYRIEARRGR
jgi:hypothetical protein